MGPQSQKEIVHGQVGQNLILRAHVSTNCQMFGHPNLDAGLNIAI